MPARLRRLTAVSLGAAALAVSVAVPAHAKTASPQKWGTAFCGGLGAWSDSVTTGGEEIKASLDEAGVTPEQGKATIVTYIGEIGDATGDFYEKVRRAGAPATTNGTKIQKEILTGIAGIERRVGDMEALAQAIPTTDITSFQTSVQALALAFDTVSDPFDDAMDNVSDLDEKNQLDKTLQKVKACQAIF
jgi:hypothetical protein